MSKKRTRTQQRDGIQDTLEAYRRFGYDYVSYGTHWFSPGANYNYRGNWLRHATEKVLRAIMATAGTLLIKVCYGAKVTGKQYKKQLKDTGAVSVCNHFSYFDTLFIRQAAGHFRSYHTMAPWNNKKGLGGAFIRRAGMIPFSNNLAATRNLSREIDRLLQNKKIVNFYAEQAMWVNYQKPRPMKEGAAFYAVKNNVPILPVFCTFYKNKRGHMKRLRINILPPVYPDENLPKKERVAMMTRQAQEEWKECYEKAYQKKLEYLPARGKRNQI